MTPPVTIIGLCYNHAPYLVKALDSILAQNYPNLQVILADDGSTDESRFILKKYQAQNPGWEFILSDINTGNCRAFNKALKMAKGKYIIDFATDDVLVRDRVAEQVAFFESLAENVGVIYSNAEVIDSKEKKIKDFYSGQKAFHPSGDVFSAILEQTFICPPTMMIRKEVFTELNGYNESLTYEDFDFWVRSSRTWHYAYQNLITCQYRKVGSGLSNEFYSEHKAAMHKSTFEVLRWAAKNIKTPSEASSLIVALRFYFRHAVYSGANEVAEDMFRLFNELGGINPVDRLLFLLSKSGIKLNGLYAIKRKLNQ